jgi:hypothetical protein
MGVLGPQAVSTTPSHEELALLRKTYCTPILGDYCCSNAQSESTTKMTDRMFKCAK